MVAVVVVTIISSSGNSSSSSSSSGGSNRGCCCSTRRRRMLPVRLATTTTATTIWFHCFVYRYSDVLDNGYDSNQRKSFQTVAALLMTNFLMIITIIVNQETEPLNEDQS